MNQSANSQSPTGSNPGQANPSRLRAPSWIVGVYLVAVTIIATSILISIWPVKDANGAWITPVTLPFIGNVTISDDLRLLIIVVLAGAAGSCIGAQTSFATFIGNRTYVPSWTWWYLLRPFIGMALALVFYFAIRGGLLSVSSGANEMSAYGVAAIAAMVGLFSKQAADKLEEVFTTLFRTEPGKGDDQRKDKSVEESLVSQHMVILKKIKACTIPSGKTEKDILLKDLADIIKPGYTRIPIFDHKNVAKGVIHQSLLFKYIAEKSIELQKNQKVFDFDIASLKDLLDYDEMSELITETLGFVPISATIGDAKSVMDNLEDCQDIFVTQSGSKTEPVQGWLTNIDIGKLLD